MASHFASACRPASNGPCSGSDPPLRHGDSRVRAADWLHPNHRGLALQRGGGLRLAIRGRSARTRPSLQPRVGVQRESRQRAAAADLHQRDHLRLHLQLTEERLSDRSPGGRLPPVAALRPLGRLGPGLSRLRLGRARDGGHDDSQDSRAVPLRTARAGDQPSRRATGVGGRAPHRLAAGCPGRISRLRIAVGSQRLAGCSGARDLFPAAGRGGQVAEDRARGRTADARIERRGSGARLRAVRPPLVRGDLPEHRTAQRRVEPRVGDVCHARRIRTGHGDGTPAARFARRRVDRWRAAIRLGGHPARKHRDTQRPHHARAAQLLDLLPLPRGPRRAGTPRADGPEARRKPAVLDYGPCAGRRPAGNLRRPNDVPRRRTPVQPTFGCVCGYCPSAWKKIPSRSTACITAIR
jgi:hypothetical protein